MPNPIRLILPPSFLSSRRAVHEARAVTAGGCRFRQRLDRSRGFSVEPENASFISQPCTIASFKKELSWPTTLSALARCARRDSRYDRRPSARAKPVQERAMSVPSSESAIVLTNGTFREIHAKTAHGLIRGPSRYRILAVIDSTCAGRDAGELLDGQPRGIAVLASVEDALRTLVERPAACIVGVATKGGVIPSDLHGDLVAAARAGLTIVNGLHHLVGDDEEIARLARASGARILDIRRPRPIRELRFWTGEVLSVPALRVSVLGTDCALGKRTTCNLLEQALGRLQIRASVVYTGQTGWLQGREHGFMLDATPNDFVPGELERAILDCWREERPDVILLEGQSGLRNPSGPCGAELLLSAGTHGVVLQHAPARRWFKGLERLQIPLPRLEDEIELVRRYGADVWAVALNDDGLERAEAERVRASLEHELEVPVVLPLGGGVDRVASRIATALSRTETGR